MSAAAPGLGRQGEAREPAPQRAVEALRARLWDEGFRPVAVFSHDHPDRARAGKAPLGAGWDERARRDPPEAAAVPDDELLAADAILCWRNSTRHELNRMSRELRGPASRQPQAGEPVLRLTNAARFNVWNGGVYTLLRPFREGDTTIVVDVGGVETEIPKVGFEGIAPKGRVQFPTSQFGFGYALTVHKAQGSDTNSG